MIDAKIGSNERGDVLVFLNGISEISMVAEALKVYAETSKKWIILMLHRLFNKISSLLHRMNYCLYKISHRFIYLSATDFLIYL